MAWRSAAAPRASRGPRCGALRLLLASVAALFWVGASEVAGHPAPVCAGAGDDVAGPEEGRPVESKVLLQTASRSSQKSVVLGGAADDGEPAAEPVQDVEVNASSSNVSEAAPGADRGASSQPSLVDWARGVMAQAQAGAKLHSGAAAVAEVLHHGTSHISSLLEKGVTTFSRARATGSGTMAAMLTLFLLIGLILLLLAIQGGALDTRHSSMRRGPPRQLEPAAKYSLSPQASNARIPAMHRMSAPPSAVSNAPPTGQPGGTPNPFIDQARWSDASMARTAQSLDSASDMQFCPDLVVPHGCECILVMPVKPRNPNSFDVLDMHGSMVLHIASSMAYPSASHQGSALSLGGRLAPNSAVSLGPRPPSAAPVKRFALQTREGEVLAQCRRRSDPLGGPAIDFDFLRPTGELCATLSQNITRDHYVLTLRHGMRCHLWGSFGSHAVSLSDEAGKLQATTEEYAVDFDKSGKYMRIRVAPLTDVGLVICALLCVYHMKSEQ